MVLSKEYYNLITSEVRSSGLSCSASSGNYLPTFRDKLSVPSSMVKKEDSLPMKVICCPETSVSNYSYWLRDSLARPVFIYFAAEG